MEYPGLTTRVHVSFIVPVRNAAAHLSRCLAAIAADARRCPEIGIEIVVVDNGSSDESAEIARGHGASVIDRPGLRVGACRNAGATATRGDILAFVDADNEIGAGWLAACVEVFGEQGTGAAGYAYRAPRDATWVQRTYDALRARTTARGEVEWLGSGNLAVRRAAFEAVGGFDERLEACEDVQLCQAVRQAGWRVVSEPGLDSIHHGDPRTLSELFFGELWRGRDNLNVSLRGPLTVRALPGTFAPIAALSCLGLLIVGLLAWPWLSGTLAAAGAAGLLVIASLKTMVIIARGRLISPLAWIQGFAVAATYESARALSLVSSATHHTRMRIARHA